MTPTDALRELEEIDLAHLQARKMLVDQIGPDEWERLHGRAARLSLLVERGKWLARHEHLIGEIDALAFGANDVWIGLAGRLALRLIPGEPLQPARPRARKYQVMPSMT